jgi:mercuric ion binding protein
MNKILSAASILICFALLPFSEVFAKQIIEAEVHGIACSFCAYGLEKKIKKMPGVETVSVDVNQGKAVITMQDSAAMEKEPLEKVVKDAGFTLKSFSVKAS